MRFRSIVRLRTLSACVGVAVGIASTITAFNFSEAAREAVLQGVRGLTPDLVMVECVSPGRDPGQASEQRPIQLTDASELTARQSRFLTAVSPLRRAWCVPRGWTGDAPVNVYACSSDLAAVLAPRFVWGRFFSSLEEGPRPRRVCVVGSETLKRLATAGAVRDGHVTLRGLEYRILGEMKDSDLAGACNVRHGLFLPWRTYLRDFGEDGRADMLIVRIPAGLSPDTAAARVRNTLASLPGGRAARVWHQEGMIRQRQRIVETIEWLVGGTCLLTLLVACIGCANVMAVSVNERSREIGLRIAVGATPLDILSMFLLEGFLLVLASGVFGIVGGYFLTAYVLSPLPRLIPDYEEWQFTFSAAALIKTLVILMLSGLLGGLLPAWRACRIEPVEALKQT